MHYPIFKLQKDNSFIEFAPSRWWLITQININWTDILFLNNDTFEDETKNVRWWIPLMFPNAWPLKDDKIYNLKQHGFARNSWFDYEIFKDKFIMELCSNTETKKLFPFDFKLEIIGDFINNWVRIIEKITNTWNKPLPTCHWLHPYFFVKNEVKKDIVFSSQENNFYDTWSTWWTQIIDNPEKFEVDFKTHKIKFNYDQAYKYIWIWSESEKDFICIEPVINNENGLIDNPLMIAVWESIENFVEYNIV